MFHVACKKNYTLVVAWHPCHVVLPTTLFPHVVCILRSEHRPASLASVQRPSRHAITFTAKSTWLTKQPRHVPLHCKVAYTLLTLHTLLTLYTLYTHCTRREAWRYFNQEYHYTAPRDLLLATKETLEYLHSHLCVAFRHPQLLPSRPPSSHLWCSLSRPTPHFGHSSSKRHRLKQLRRLHPKDSQPAIDAWAAGWTCLFSRVHHPKLGSPTVLYNLPSVPPETLCAPLSRQLDHLHDSPPTGTAFRRGHCRQLFQEDTQVWATQYHLYVSSFRQLPRL